MTKLPPNATHAADASQPFTSVTIRTPSRLAHTADGGRWATLHFEVLGLRSTMKTLLGLLALLGGCLFMFGADTDVHMFTSAETNGQTGTFYVKAVFTRDGQTNLVRIQKKNSQSIVWVYQFYHTGQLVGSFVVFPEESTFSTEASPYCMSLKYGPAGELRSAKIGDEHGLLLDEFSFTNGVFAPVQGPLRQIGLMKPKFPPAADPLKRNGR